MGYGDFPGKIVLQYIFNDIEANELELFWEQVDQHQLSTDLKGEAMTLAQCLEQRGFEKGIHQGMQQGVQQGEAAIMMRLIQQRFGIMPAFYVRQIAEADAETLLRWSQNILDAKSLEEIFE